MILIFNIIILVILLLMFYMFFIETNWIRIKRYKKSINKDSNTKLKIVHLSDVHGKYYFFRRSLVSMINDIDADFVLITGDIIDKFSELDMAVSELSKLSCKNIIFIKGNHETYESRFLNKRVYIDTDKIINKLREINIEVLVEEDIEINLNNKNIGIYGVDNSDYNFTKFNINTKFVKHFKEYDYTIILAHMPQSYEYIKQKNIVPNMFLAGHTHGGQINIPILFKLAGRFLKHEGFTAGYSEDDFGNIFCVSRGVGNTTLYARLFNRPEIIVYEIDI